VSGRGRGERSSRRRGRRSWLQRAVLAFSTCLVGGLLVAAGGLAYGYGKYSQLARVELGAVLTERGGSDEPQNFLLVGVDSAGALTSDDPALRGRAGIGGLRSDTMLVLRVEPGTGAAALLSLPRDLWVPLASGGLQRLNSAIEVGGPGELIDTIEEYLGIPINHYVQVDFAGFQGLVEAVDGVPLYFPTPVRDRGSFLDIEEAGCVTLDADQALAYVRARNFQTFEDGRWRTDPSSDLGRQSRQQDFIVRALRRAIDKGVRNPVTLDRLVDAGLATVTVDDVLTADDIVTLASGLRSFDPDDLVLNQLPVRDDSVGGADVLRLLDGPAQPILDSFRGAGTGELAPAAVRVQVLNGSGEAGQAGRVAAELADRGFVTAGTGEADRFDLAQTVVRHAPGQGQAAELVARWLARPVLVEEVDDALDADVVVVTGADFVGVRTSLGPPPAPTTTVPGAPPSTVAASTSTTSTSLIGEVPKPPPGIDC
jgi:polyisoprenyl-teichoic acid--peptidoglycan teichoic acid transferase